MSVKARHTLATRWGWLAGPRGEETLVSLVLTELSVFCLSWGMWEDVPRMSWGMWEDVPQMSILSKSKWPPYTLSPHKPKATSRKTECRQISVTSGTILKVTFYLNMHTVCSPSAWRSRCSAAQRLKTCHSIRDPGRLKGVQTKRSPCEAG